MRCSSFWVSASTLPRPSASARAISVSPTISRIALSAADFTFASGARLRLARAKADVDAVDPGDARPQHALDRRREMPPETGLRDHAIEGAEAHDDARFVGQHPVEAADHPEQHDRDNQ